jgi:hypothetical protein
VLSNTPRVQTRKVTRRMPRANSRSN